MSLTPNRGKIQCIKLDNDDYWTTDNCIETNHYGTKRMTSDGTSYLANCLGWIVDKITLEDEQQIKINDLFNIRGACDVYGIKYNDDSDFLLIFGFQGSEYGYSTWYRGLFMRIYNTKKQIFISPSENGSKYMRFTSETGINLKTIFLSPNSFILGGQVNNPNSYDSTEPSAYSNIVVTSALNEEGEEEIFLLYCWSHYCEWYNITTNEYYVNFETADATVIPNTTTSEKYQAIIPTNLSSLPNYTFEKTFFGVFAFGKGDQIFKIGTKYYNSLGFVEENTRYDLQGSRICPILIDITDYRKQN